MSSNGFQLRYYFFVYYYYFFTLFNIFFFVDFASDTFGATTISENGFFPLFQSHDLPYHPQPQTQPNSTFQQFVPHKEGSPKINFFPVTENTSSTTDQKKIIHAVYQYAFYQHILDPSFKSTIILVDDLIPVLTDTYLCPDDTNYQVTYEWNEGVDSFTVHIRLECTRRRGLRPIHDTFSLLFVKYTPPMQQALQDELQQEKVANQRFQDQVKDLETKTRSFESINDQLQTENKRLKKDNQDLQERLAQLEKKYNDTLLASQSALTNAKALCQTLAVFETISSTTSKIQ